MNSNTDTFVVLSKRDWLGGQTKPKHFWRYERSCISLPKQGITPAEQHTVYEAELVGMVLGTWLAKDYLRDHKLTLCLDNQAAIRALMNVKPHPSQHFVDEFERNPAQKGHFPPSFVTPLPVSSSAIRQHQTKDLQEKAKEAWTESTRFARPAVIDWSTTSSPPNPTWSWSQSSPSRKRVSQRNCARAHVPLNGYLKTNWKAPERALPSLQKDSKGDRYPLSPHMPPDEEHLFRSPPSTLLCRYYLKMGLCPNQIIKPI